ncbi:hypothetical protein DYB32_003140 [Aphanomyces invadans]|uniref:3-hydroxyisobutyryl-coenzyme A hydrolase n=1 Tax=Aphanomyces invadans TaxID=157072 RepID=A0A418B1D9_9STRA|nr:hypothetical protein DYB32_003140 [Aphanomyces invadans]
MSTDGLGKMRTQNQEARLVWKPDYELKFGLVPQEGDFHNHIITKASCGFCDRYGREGKSGIAGFPTIDGTDTSMGGMLPDGKRRRVGCKVWEAFRTDHIKRHLETEHPQKWAEYQNLSTEAKLRFFSQNPAPSSLDGSDIDLHRLPFQKIPSVTLEKVGTIAILKLNDPTRLNALTTDMGIRLEELVREIIDRVDEFSAVVLTGEGRVFSAGGDLAFLQARIQDTATRNSAIMRAYYERFMSLRKLPIPLIAALNGAALGEGMCISLFADARVIARDAKVGFTFVNLGLHPVLSGEEALIFGLATKIVDKEDVLKTALALAEEMTAGSSVATRTLLRTLRMQQDVGVEIALAREVDCQATSFSSADYQEGVNAVSEKRKPAFHAVTMRKFYGRFLSLRSLPVPLIAALNGPAIGAGMCISLFADARVVAKDAKLGFTFVHLGLHPEDVVAEAVKLAEEMTSGSSIATRSLLQTLRLKQDQGLDMALHREASSQAVCYATPDYREGVDAIASKRKPVFGPLEHYK